ncbi:hypothetical protein WA026_014622 [Henosepilachna vigintioctopunctata]|uniref:Transmembrane protein 223 n=1 Tax=Henosepilachna vigintioctopunctata TaxID=420089 RepID=A0AAW1VFF5_9CUCU
MNLIRITTNFRSLIYPKLNKLSLFRWLHISPIKRNVLSAAEVNTNVVKDVILFKYENPRFFKILNLFALVQFGFWTYLSLTAYETLRDVPIDEHAEKWWERINLGENKYRNTITTVCFLIGYGIIVMSWMYTLKSIRFLILNKGGQKCTIVTYGPFGKNRMFTLELENISCNASRISAPSYIPLKVKGHYFHYLCDMRGEFKNSHLFDHTVGLKRNLK